MANLRVIRGDGDKQAPDIVDKHLSTTAALLARGRGEINYDYCDRMTETCQIVHRAHIPGGKVVEAVEKDDRWRGKVTSFSRIRSVNDDFSLTVDCNVDLERPLL